MKRIAGVLTAAGLLVGAYGWAIAGGPGAKSAHRSTGIVTTISGSTIAMKEPAGFHSMAITPGTRIAIAKEDRVRALGIGDYVGEECVPDGKGGLRALRLTLYCPAWMENASPEN